MVYGATGIINNFCCCLSVFSIIYMALGQQQIQLLIYFILFVGLPAPDVKRRAPEGYSAGANGRSDHTGLVLTAFLEFSCFNCSMFVLECDYVTHIKNSDCRVTFFQQRTCVTFSHFMWMLGNAYVLILSLIPKPQVFCYPMPLIFSLQVLKREGKLLEFVHINVLLWRKKYKLCNQLIQIHVLKCVGSQDEY